MARGSVGKILPASCCRGEENFPPSFSASCAHAQPMCVETRPHGRSPLSDGAIRSMTLPSVLYEALRPRVGSHILHGLGARIYEYDWVRSGFIDTPLCRRHTTPPLSRTSWPSAPHAYGGCSSLLFADKAKPICEAQIGGELIKMHGHRARTCFMRHNGRKWVWKGGEKTGRGSHVGKEKEGNTYQYEDPTTSQRTWTAALQHRQAMTPFQSRQEQVQTPWLRV